MDRTAELHFRHTDLLDWTLDGIQREDKRIVVNEGGTGSSKTFSNLQAHLILSFQEEGKLYTVVRDRLPALRRSALRDFRIVLQETGAGAYLDENKSDLTFTNRLTGTAIEFAAFDSPQKARGPRRDRLFCNEANELYEETFRQLAMRTRLGIVLDYNPSMQRHWIYDKVLTRTDCLHLKSTYHDNGFLTEEEIREIEQDVPVYEDADGSRHEDWDLTYAGKGVLVSGDPYRWAVFGLGKRGAPSEAIYPLSEVGTFPQDVESVLGLDFGYNHPMVLTRVAIRDAEGKPALHIDELLHASYLTTEDLVGMLPSLGVTKHDVIYADGSRPESIETLERAGYNVQPADRSPGSVYEGISFVKGFRLVFTARSDRSRAQFQDYRWKKHADGTVLDEPVKLNDDAPDAVRYGAFSQWSEDLTPSPGYRSLWD